ncbi:hypothetical protein ND748_06690 [Frankia sp. AiPs1]|uniref:hypothetical protein n=1 Tax=Frankia sp. AiPs1 TaxID=573493 RepID=UPI0020437ECB|nr:hypothetical protein [Frankia sp. AiPs1]MCM3921358.1 hypothetical protein [Frankia sp. AiPs1]
MRRISTAAAGVTLCVGAGLAAAASGTPPFVLDLTSGGSWLANESTGTVTHLQSTTGRADAAVTVPGAVGHRLSVQRNGPDLLVCDEDAGLLHLIEPQRLTPARTATLRPGTTVIPGDREIYAVDGAGGRVRRLDGRSLTDVGPVIDLGGALGAVARTRDGTLWAPVRTRGSVVPIRDGVASTPIPVARPDHQIDVVLAQDRPVVVDGTTGTAVPVTGARPGPAIALPVTLTTASAPSDPVVVAADATEWSTVPILDTVAGRLLLADVDTSAVAVHDLPAVPGEGRARAGGDTAQPEGGTARTGGNTSPSGGGTVRTGGVGDAASADTTAPTRLPDIDRPAGSPAASPAGSAGSPAGSAVIPGDEAAPRRLGPPIGHDGMIYIPDQDARMVWVFDTRTGGFTPPIVVPGSPGEPATAADTARITVTVEGDQVWVNDPAGPDAVLIDGTRRATVAKQPAGLPGQADTAPARPLPAPPPRPQPTTIEQPRSAPATVERAGTRPQPPVPAGPGTANVVTVPPPPSTTSPVPRPPQPTDTQSPRPGITTQPEQTFVELPGGDPTTQPHSPRRPT